MSKIFFLLFLLIATNLSAAKEKIWDFQYSFNLKKDKIATVLIDKDSAGKGKNRYELSFRWTLYDGSKNLILLTKYMGYPNQYVLSMKRSLDRVKVKLLQDGGDYHEGAYALIVFSNFEPKKQVATLDVYIKDKTKRIQVTFK